MPSAADGELVPTALPKTAVKPAALLLLPDLAPAADTELVSFALPTITVMPAPGIKHLLDFPPATVPESVPFPLPTAREVYSYLPDDSHAAEVDPLPFAFRTPTLKWAVKKSQFRLKSRPLRSQNRSHSRPPNDHDAVGGGDHTST